MSTSPAVGPVTFVFTDVEGSTRLWEAHPETMPSAVARHLGMLHQAMDRDGTVVKEMGDGIFAVFPNPHAAVSATLAAQRSLATASWPATGPLRARMGVHTGEAIFDHGDYFGNAVNRCARVMAIAHGGQIIVSDTTYALVRDDPPRGVSFLDLGEHRLRDLTRPEHIRQIVHPELQAEFPPLRSLGTFRNNLPAELSSFIGRTAELAAVKAALESSRLVTLTGAGGAGKTRLALQAAADRIEMHRDGVWLVDLAGLADPGLVAHALVSALHVPELLGRSAIDALAMDLATRNMLVVLDNCEHVIAAAAEVTATVLRSAPHVRIIATSREPLNVPGEVSWRVPSLSLPSGAANAGGTGSEAVALFVERARAADPTFGLTPETRLAIETICRRLDGLPLAIELAAARVRALAVVEIAQRLNDRFSLLTGGSRTALPRQRTLEAAVAWSYDLLEPEERTLFIRLSVFAGSFDLAAVESVCSGNGIESTQVIGLLPKLVDKSLVSAVRMGGGTRYRLLETLRDYARVRLATSPDVLMVRDAHTRWAVATAEALGRLMFGPDQARGLAEIAASLDDLRTALERTLEAGDRETGVAIMSALDQWWPIGPVREARRWLDALLADTSALSPEMLGRGLSLYGVILAIQGEHTEAAAAQEQALGLLRAAGDRRRAAWSTHYLGVARWESGDPQQVKELTLEALAAFETLGEPVGALRCLWWMILWELEFGEVDEAMRFGARLDELIRHIPAPIAQAHAAEAAGLLARVRGDLDESGRQLRIAVQRHTIAQNPGCLSHCLEHVALWSLDRNEPEQAARLLGAVDAIREDVVGTTAVPPFERMWHERASAAAREQLDAASYERAWGLGRAMSVEEATAAGLEAVGPDEPVATSPDREVVMGSPSPKNHH